MDWGGPLFELDSNKRWGPNCDYHSSYPLGRYCTHQDIISGRPEQVYLPFDKDLNDLERGYYLIRTRINAWGAKMRPLIKLSYGQLLKSSLGHLARYCTHQETISGQLSRSIFYLTKIGTAWGGAIIRVRLE